MKASGYVSKEHIGPSPWYRLEVEQYFAYQLSIYFRLPPVFGIRANSTWLQGTSYLITGERSEEIDHPWLARAPPPNSPSFLVDPVALTATFLALL